MKHRGISLLEVVIATAVMMIVMTGSLELFRVCSKSAQNIEIQADSRANLRIANDYLCDRIKNGTVQNVGKNIVRIDGEEIYLKNEIIRVKEDSIQIACNVGGFEVSAYAGNRLYKVTVSSTFGVEQISMLIYSRGI